MSIEQNAAQWIDSQIQRQIVGPKTRKSIRQAGARRRDERPLNVLGCMALIHAVRSIDSGDRVRVAARRATTA